jgi:hypothetical protein
MKLMSKTGVTLGCLWIGCTLAGARIGDTEKQCEERYGKARPFPMEKSLYGYCKSPFLLMLHFSGGRCDHVAYIKADDSTPEIREEISEDEQYTLRKANGGEKAWKKSPTSNDRMIRFETTDGELGSVYVRDARILIIVTREEHKRLEELAKAMEEKLKGAEK